MSLSKLIMYNDQRLSDIEVSDLLQDAPIMQRINAVAASNGTTHRYKKETGESSTAFRDLYTGVAKTKSADTAMSEDLKILDASFSVDVAEANGYRGGRDAYLEIELRRSLRAAMFATEKQIIQGTNSSAGGFDGLEQLLDNSDDDMVIDAGGSVAANQANVWLVRSGDADLSYVAGNDGNISFNTEDEPGVIPVLEGVGSYGAYYIPVTGWGGMQFGSIHSVARIANLDDVATLNDDLISDALSLFPAAKMPNQIWMSRKSLKQLQQSRTATNVTGAPAPFPTEAFGFEIVVSDAIPTNAEPIVAA